MSFSHAVYASLLAALAAALCTLGQADEPLPLAPVKPASVDDGDRIDPMRPTRLSAAERDKLYEQAGRDADRLEQQAIQLRRLTKLLRPTVVHIDATKPLPRPRNGRVTQDEAGSGVIAAVADRTVVITNRHVVHGAELDEIAVRLDDGRELRPVRSWSDAGTDIAVLQVEGPDLQTARLATGDRVEIGDTVLAIGSPFGLSHSITLGIVSAKGRRNLELGKGTVKFQDFIQTDAAINPGNSGGPLVNLRGEVVGLNTAIASNSGGSEGIGFAIPISMVMFVARQLLENGSVPRAYLGVSLDRDFTQQSAHRLGMVRSIGARVESLIRNSPADAAGIRPDDVILEYDGTPVEDDDHLLSLVGTTLVDTTVELVIFRDRRRLTLRMPVAARKDFEKPVP